MLTLFCVQVPSPAHHPHKLTMSIRDNAFLPIANEIGLDVRTLKAGLIEIQADSESLDSPLHYVTDYFDKKTGALVLTLEFWHESKPLHKRYLCRYAPDASTHDLEYAQTGNGSRSTTYKKNNVVIKARIQPVVQCKVTLDLVSSDDEASENLSAFEDADRNEKPEAEEVSEDLADFSIADAPESDHEESDDVLEDLPVPKTPAPSIASDLSVADLSGADYPESDNDEKPADEEADELLEDLPVPKTPAPSIASDLSVADYPESDNDEKPEAKDAEEDSEPPSTPGAEFLPISESTDLNRQFGKLAMEEPALPPPPPPAPAQFNVPVLSAPAAPAHVARPCLCPYTARGNFVATRGSDRCSFSSASKRVLQAHIAAKHTGLGANERRRAHHRH